MAEVRLKNLTKRFGNIVAVDSVSLDIQENEFLILLGPSGCGKTTTLRCIAGLETPDEGEIYIGGTLVNDLPPRERDVAMVFQSYALYPHMSVFGNLAYPLKIRKVQREEIEKKVERVAKLLKIEELLGRKPGQLSGGQAQRVALGRAIIREPKVFLMDEPLANLDAKLRVYMRAELKKLQNDLGVTTIYVTHDQVEAMTMADRVAVMNQGKLMQVGSGNKLYDHPENLFVAGFIGSPPMNFIDCTLVKKDDTLFLNASIFGLPVPAEIEKILATVKGSELILGVRPEAIHIHKKRVQNSVEANVYVSETLGSEVIVTLELQGNLFKVKAPPAFEASAGEKVWMTFNENKIHIFDKRTQEAII